MSQIFILSKTHFSSSPPSARLILLLHKPFNIGFQRWYVLPPHPDTHKASPSLGPIHPRFFNHILTLTTTLHSLSSHLLHILIGLQRPRTRPTACQLHPCRLCSHWMVPRGISQSLFIRVKHMDCRHCYRSHYCTPELALFYP